MPTNTAAHRYFTREEAAEHMRVSVETVKRAIYAGKLRAKKTGANGGGIYIIRDDDLDAWFEGLVDA
jgi:excisionase family DNA binding protein